MFNKINERKVNNDILIEYENEIGTKHFHLKNNEQEQTFLIAFQTIPENNRGIPHILEHLVLEGSKNYDVKSPFFLMIKRSMQTFMNAMTYPDKTIYPFATINEKDYFNLLSVYLDSVLNPKLEHNGFLQEGWRYDFDKEQNLIYKGIVYNEMKGYYNNRNQHIEDVLSAEIFPGTIYDKQYGGKPIEITDLSYQELLDFYKKNYNPANAIIMTSGNIDILKLHNVLNNKIKENNYRKIDKTKIKESVFNSKTKIINCNIPSENEEHSLAISFNLGLSKSEFVKDLSFIHHILFSDNGIINNSILDKNCRLSELTEVQSYKNEASFNIIIDGLNKKNINEIKKHVFSELKNIELNGVNKNIVDSYIDTYELINKKKESDMPLGLEIMMEGINSAFNGDDIIDDLNFSKKIENIRKRFHNKEHIKKIMKELLDERPKLIIYLQPDKDFFEKENKVETKKLKSIQSKMSLKEIDDIKKQNQSLILWQKEIKDEKVLPYLEIRDIDKDFKKLENVEKIFSDKTTLAIFKNMKTNGVGYLDLKFDISDVKMEDLKWYALYSDCLNLMPLNKKSWKKSMEYKDLLMKDFCINIDAIPNLEDKNKGSIVFSISGTELEIKVKNFIKIIDALLNNTNFNKANKIKNTIKNIVDDYEQNIIEYSSEIALNEINKDSSFYGKIQNEIDSNNYIDFLKNTKKTFNKNKILIIEKFKAINEKIKNSNSIIYGTENTIKVMQDIQDKFKFKGLKHFEEKTVNLLIDNKKVIIPKNININFNFQVHQTISYKNKQSILLDLAARLIANEKLHKEIREIGGAYGSNAKYDFKNSIFILSSYRDPEINKTLNVFEDSTQWFINTDFSEEQINQIKIMCLKLFFKPDSIQNNFNNNINFDLFGITDEIRQERFETIINADIKSIKEAFKRYILNENKNVVSFCSKEKYNIEKKHFKNFNIC